jgi:hypothetical protein
MASWKRKKQVIELYDFFEWIMDEPNISMDAANILLAKTFMQTRNGSSGREK